MDKKLLIQQAEQFIPKDLLYGSYKGYVFKYFIETAADGIVHGDESPDEIASKIIARVETFSDAGLFTNASEVVKPTVTPEMTASEIIEDFINRIPYKDNINTTKDSFINISEELRKYSTKMNEDYTFGEFHRSLDSIYRVLLSNEYIKPSRMDKIEQIIRIINDLRSVKDDFDEISKTSIKDETFEQMLGKLVNKIDDEFKVDGMELDEYINTKYNQYSLRRYNSVDSKPQNVEQIGLTSNGANLEVTNEYIFLSPDEVKTITDNSSKDNTDTTSHTLITVINGVELAKSLDTLHSYDDRISLIRESIKGTSNDDSLIKELYSALLIRYAKKENQLELYRENGEDMEVLLRNELVEIKNEINDIKSEYYRTFGDVDKRLSKVKEDFFNIKSRIQQMGLSMHHELDNVYELLRVFEIKYQNSRDNVSHIEKRKEDEIASRNMTINQLERQDTFSPAEEAAKIVRLEKYRLERDRLEEEYGLDNSTEQISRVA
ncbi:MAG: hypothetical protein K5666_02950 [Bacilli bacterium]|nr:hypothetical protein [Bacilli bacterium]